jgi:hypothetical protein
MEDVVLCYLKAHDVMSDGSLGLHAESPHTFGILTRPGFQSRTTPHVETGIYETVMQFHASNHRVFGAKITLNSRNFLPTLTEPVVTCIRFRVFLCANAPNPSLLRWGPAHVTGVSQAI